MIHINNISVYKTDDNRRLVFGWASVAMTFDGQPLEDRQHDIIEPEELETAAYEYVLQFGDTGEEHQPSLRKKGRLVESCVFTEEKQRAMGLPAGVLPVGWWIGFRIDDDAAWEKIKDGTYRMFSIEGRATRTPASEDEPPRFSPDSPNRFDFIQEIDKFNPNHDHRGRFTSAANAVTPAADAVASAVGSGTGFHGGFGETKGAKKQSSIAENSNAMKQKYPLTKSGYFGEKGKNCRIIASSSPKETSIDFYKKLGTGGITKPLSNGKGTITTLGDGTRIVHRIITSTKDSPAVEISISGSPEIKNQKIHFILEGD